MQGNPHFVWHEKKQRRSTAWIWAGGGGGGGGSFGVGFVVWGFLLGFFASSERKQYICGRENIFTNIINTCSDPKAKCDVECSI